MNKKKPTALPEPATLAARIEADPKRKADFEQRAMQVQQRWRAVLLNKEEAQRLYEAFSKAASWGDAVTYIKANPPSAEVICALVFAAQKAAFSKRGKHAADTALQNDRNGKQAAKAEIEKLWNDWQSGRTKYKSGADFDRAMSQKFPVITSTKTTERWRSKWAEQAKKD